MRDSFANFALDQLRALGDVRRRTMFGGVGLYCGDAFFGIVFDDRLYFKTDESTVLQYASRGMKSFQPNERQRLQNYYEVPPEIVEDPDELIVWALQALNLSA